MKRMLIAVGIIVAIILIAISGVFEDETPPPSFTMGQGPGDDLIKPLVVACTPDAGYDFCYTNTYGAATATIQSTFWKGKSGFGDIDGARRRYYIDEVYVNVKYRGDKLYRSSSTSWISCGSSGCSATAISPGKQVIVTAPSKVIPPIQFTAWDKFTSTSGAWWYSYAQFGWLSSTSAYVIGCYDNTDCDSGSYCDKSGSWDTWSCEIDPCPTMPDPSVLCDGFDLWSQKCVYGDIVRDQLLETNSIACGCIFQETPNICDGYDLWSQKQTVRCVEGLSKDQLIESNCVVCGYLCTTDEIKSYSCTDGTIIITERCIDNTWVEVEPETCPLNWENLEMILQGYIEDIQLYLEKLL